MKNIINSMFVGLIIGFVVGITISGLTVIMTTAEEFSGRGVIVVSIVSAIIGSLATVSSAVMKSPAVFNKHRVFYF